MRRVFEIDSRIKVQNGYDLLAVPPVSILVNEFTEKSASEFCNKMELAHNAKQPIIPIVIDSRGGQVHSLMAMLSEINNSEIPVATICVGKAMSCGAILLCAGARGYRFADQYSDILVHEVAAGTGGKNMEIQADAKHIESLNKRSLELMAKFCDQEKDYFVNMIHDKGHADIYLTPKEAKKHNIIDHIKAPNLKINISVDMVLE